jgi:hypothetical protein
MREEFPRFISPWCVLLLHVANHIRGHFKFPIDLMT